MFANVFLPVYNIGSENATQKNAKKQSINTPPVKYFWTSRQLPCGKPKAFDEES